MALVFAGMALALWGIFALLSSYPVFLYLYYTAAPNVSRALAAGIHETSGQAAVARVNPAPSAIPLEQPPEPKRDVSLPEGHYLAIPRIGVDTVIWEAPTAEYETALKKGVWRVPEFPKPDKPDGRPIILAAHRFGYTAWTQAYREQNSFYNLPKVEVGDTVTLTWDQHKYEYKVTKVEEGTEITDYQSDLILYTCKFLVSPQRVFVYAEQVK